MKVNRIDHICIAVKNLEEARKVWEPLMGKDKPDDEYIDEPEKIKVARYYIGEVGFELMESTTPDGDVARHIEKRGGDSRDRVWEAGRVAGELSPARIHPCH